MKKYIVKSWDQRINEQYKYEGEERLKEIMDYVSESYAKTSFVSVKSITECITEDKDKVYTYDSDADMFYYVHNITGSRFSAHYPFETEEWNQLNLLVKSER